MTTILIPPFQHKMTKRWKFKISKLNKFGLKYTMIDHLNISKESSP